MLKQTTSPGLPGKVASRQVACGAKRRRTEFRASESLHPPACTEVALARRQPTVKVPPDLATGPSNPCAGPLLIARACDRPAGRAVRRSAV